MMPYTCDIVIKKKLIMNLLLVIFVIIVLLLNLGFSYVKQLFMV
jgi:hypothetical protein